MSDSSLDKYPHNPAILLITPPLTQINTPYPATAYLKGFLKKHNFIVSQVDLGLDLVLAIFSKKGLESLFKQIKLTCQQLSISSNRVLQLENEYLKTIDRIILFLQNKDPTLAYRICNQEFLPAGPRIEAMEDLNWAFGPAGLQDKAKFLATLYLEDLVDLIVDTVCPYFGFSRYAEKLALSATFFHSLEGALKQPNNFVDTITLKLLKKYLLEVNPDIVGFTIPFPGCLFSALKCSQYIKVNWPRIKIVIGGGFVSTELRDLHSPDIFKYIDFMVTDDGENPLLQIVNYLSGSIAINELQRTFILSENKVLFVDGDKDLHISPGDKGTPDYSDLQLDSYISILEIANPMHRLWGDGRWNKLTLAHGCYWKKCSFCDISLDHVKQYDPVPVRILVEQIETIVKQTGQSGFHFVDEAAPPDLLRDLAIEILTRNITITWWTNIRFEKTYTESLCKLLATAGCIAVTGGLETPCDRLLRKMKKGVTVAQAARVTKNFQEAGIMVHCYLMYGFPSETSQETIDSLEIVRQLFENDLVQSGFWHKFTLTAHSPMAKKAEKFALSITGPEKWDFAHNDLYHVDKTGCNHELFGSGLKKALYNFMYGIGLDFKLDFWFNFEVPKTSISPNFIRTIIRKTRKNENQRGSSRVLWLGNVPQILLSNNPKKIDNRKKSKLIFYEKAETFELKANRRLCEWLFAIISKVAICNTDIFTLHQVEKSYETEIKADFSDFQKSHIWQILRQKGLLIF